VNLFLTFTYTVFVNQDDLFVFQSLENQCFHPLFKRTRHFPNLSVRYFRLEEYFKPILVSYRSRLFQENIPLETCSRMHSIWVVKSIFNPEKAIVVINQATFSMIYRSNYLIQQQNTLRKRHGYTEVYGIPYIINIRVRIRET
jgi:hypothetical protein